jgi:hypothetical protein
LTVISEKPTDGQDPVVLEHFAERPEPPFGVLFVAGWAFVLGAPNGTIGVAHGVGSGAATADGDAPLSAQVRALVGGARI